MSGKIDKKRVRRSFSRFGGGGDLFALVGERLAARLDEIAAAPSWILDMGGDGVRMAGRYESARVLAADIAAPRLRGGRGGKRIYPVVADAEHLPAADGAADMVWSNLCLEWTDMGKALSEAARVLRPEGLLLFSTLGRDTLREMREVFGAGRVHEFMDMHDVGDLLAGGGFAEPVLEAEHLTLTYGAAEDAVREVRLSGCGCALPVVRAMGACEWRRALSEYGRKFGGEDGRVPATYEIIYALAWRKPPARGELPVRFVRRG